MAGTGTTSIASLVNKSMAGLYIDGRAAEAAPAAADPTSMAKNIIESLDSASLQPAYSEPAEPEPTKSDSAKPAPAPSTLAKPERYKPAPKQAVLVRLDSGDYAALQRFAARKGTTASALIRGAVKDLLGTA
jgi:hypothetical protein